MTLSTTINRAASSDCGVFRLKIGLFPQSRDDGPATDLAVLPDGDVVVQKVGPAWALSAVRLETGEIEVTGGTGLSRFRYSIDDGATWVDDIAPAVIDEAGAVIFEPLGAEARASGRWLQTEYLEKITDEDGNFLDVL